MGQNRELAEKIRAKKDTLLEWFHAQESLAPPPLYCSVDMRDSGFKTVPVDCNLYPAGFNNLCPADLRSAPPVFAEKLKQAALARGLSQNIRKVILLPEFHTTNQFYIENLSYLIQILEDSNIETRIGWISDPVIDSLELQSASGKTLKAYPLQVEQGQVKADGMEADLVLLNNDFSQGYPPLLDQISQPIIPTHLMGWHSRKKSKHFEFYNDLASEFARIVDIDPWLVRIDTQVVDQVHFGEMKGIDQVASTVDRILESTRQEYQKRNIDRKPFVFIKSNAGTYGMGIMSVYSGEEVLQANRRTKNKMSVGKNKSQIESVIVQEGIPAGMKVDEMASEPVIYLAGCELIGGFIRANKERGSEENLNSKGMVFMRLCMSDLRKEEMGPSSGSFPVLETVYGAIARLSALALGREIKAEKK